MSADLVLTRIGAIGLMPGAAGPAFIAIKGRRILAVGLAQRMAQCVGPQTRFLDCRGGIAVPGFNDAHCHPLAFAITLRHVDCSAPRVRCIADLQAALRTKAATCGAERWIRGANYEPADLAEGRGPDRWQLDQAVPDHPVVLIERSGQHCVLNSRALALCGIDQHGADSDAGQIHRDPRTGRLSGVVSGNHAAVAAAIPALEASEIEAGLRAADRAYLAAGITSLQDTSWSNTYAHWQAVDAYKADGLIAPRLTLCVGIDALREFSGRGLKTGSGGPHLRLGAVKIALDESLGDTDPPQDAIDSAALAAHAAGFQLAFHVPDVGLLQRSLAALDFVRGNSLSAPLRPRFEHCPACPPHLLAQLAESGATVVAQPNLLYLTGQRYLHSVSEEQQRWLFPFRSFLAHGIPLAFGSDSPLTPCDPLQAMRTAATRRVDGGATLAPGERIPMHEALRLYTEAGARVCGEEHEKGSIRPGQLADLAILDAPAGDAEAPSEARVMLTLIDGKVRWESAN